ncbi:MAG: PrsW family intramembrane metalloprotease [Methanobrevibacter sp.]|jgi:RsiW-degrading membrane proteinase PrsW (M82 family)|nr:PrsW family intramembrane metalloprotease [Candidatus Methanoflexus mossambicus]
MNVLLETLESPFLGIALAILIPFIFLISLIDDKRMKLLFCFFCWGSVAGILALTLNDTIMAFHGATTATPQMVTTVAIVEEFLKALPLLLFLFSTKFRKLDRLVILCAVAIGFGFSIEETIYYFLGSGDLTGIGSIILVIVRSLSTSLMHAMTTGVVGLGLFVMQKYRNIGLPLFYGLISISITIHGIFNLFLANNQILIGLIIPISMYFIGMLFLMNFDEDDYNRNKKAKIKE